MTSPLNTLGRAMLACLMLSAIAVNALAADSPKKPIRIWMHVSERDNGATQASTGFHNWVIANIKVAEALKAKGYDYQFVYAKNAGHTEAKVINQTYPAALEFVWKGYTPSGK